MKRPTLPSPFRARFNNLRRWFAYGFRIIVIVGNVSFPLAFMTGVVG